MESNKQEKSASDTTELGGEDIRFMKATNRSIVNLIERQLDLEELVQNTIEWLLGEYRAWNEYMGYQVLKCRTETQEYKGEAIKAIKYGREFQPRKLEELEGTMKGFLKKYYQDGHPHTDKKTNKGYYKYK